MMKPGIFSLGDISNSAMKLNPHLWSMTVSTNLLLSTFLEGPASEVC